MNPTFSMGRPEVAATNNVIASYSKKFASRTPNRIFGIFATYTVDSFESKKTKNILILYILRITEVSNGKMVELLRNK